MRTLALAISALLLLTSCSDDPTPIEPTDPPQATGVEAPVLPDESKTETPDAAIAFVAHWIETFNFSVNAGKSRPFKTLNESECDGCKSYEKEIVRLNGDGAEVRGFKWTAGRSVLSENRELEIDIESQAYEVRDAPSDDWSKVLSAKYTLGFELSWTKVGWRVSELYIPQDPK